MGHRRSGSAAQSWIQGELLGEPPGVGGRQAYEPGPAGGGGYLNKRNPSEVAKGAVKKIAKFRKPHAVGENGAGPEDLREESLLEELEAMGVSRVMLKVAHAIGFEAFMTMWRILDAAPETLTDSGSSIAVRMQRLGAYKRYQRNRFIEAMVAMGMTHPEISRSVRVELGENVTDRHIWRLMAAGRVKE